MTTTTLTILDRTVYGQASGNYDGSSADFNSDAAKAVGYYLGQGSIQTVYIRVTGFLGEITLQGTLNDDPNSDQAVLQWVDLDTFGDPNVATSGVHPITVVGNFTWIRARVTSFDGGTIDSITITY